MTYPDNVVEMPARREKLLADIRKGFNMMDEGAVIACVAMAELRAGFADNDVAFGVYLAANNITMNKDTRRAMIQMGREPDKLREVLAKSKRRSLHTIYNFEWPDLSKNFDRSHAARPQESPHLAKAEELVREGVKPREFAEAIGLGPTQARNVMREAERRLKLKTKPAAELPDPATLSEKGKVRFDTMLEAHKKRLEKDFAQRVYHEALRQAEKAVGDRLDYFKRKMDDVDRFLDGMNKGVFTRAEFRKLMMCMHPDNSASKEMREECLQLLRSKEGVLVKPERDNDAPPLPATWADLMAMRRQAKSK